MYLRTIDENEATGKIAEIYAKQIAQAGFVMDALKCFTARPDLLPIYVDFSDRIRANFSLGMRAWRLITFVAAKQVPSSYCSHVYAKQLIADLGEACAELGLSVTAWFDSPIAGGDGNHEFFICAKKPT